MDSNRRRIETSVVPCGSDTFDLIFIATGGGTFTFQVIFFLNFFLIFFLLFFNFYNFYSLISLLLIMKHVMVFLKKVTQLTSLIWSIHFFIFFFIFFILILSFISFYYFHYLISSSSIFHVVGHLKPKKKIFSAGTIKIKFLQWINKVVENKIVFCLCKVNNCCPFNIFCLFFFLKAEKVRENEVWFHRCLFLI